MFKTCVASACVALWLAALGGCASKKFVRAEVGDVNTKVDTLTATVEETQERTRRGEDRIGAVDAKTEAAGRSASEARAAADAASAAARDVDRRLGNRLDYVETASRSLVYSVTLSEDQGNFKFGKTDLPDEAKSRLDTMLDALKANPNGAFIEIEGHTDNVGSPTVNYELGLERAEAVKRYLYEQQQIPLHKINVISFGEDKPVAPNNSRQGRAENRRVVVKVVLPGELAASAPPPPDSATGGDSDPRPTVRASRIFSGPNQYPPRNFAAYGIVAFRSQATSQSTARYQAICEGYLAAVPGAMSLEARQVPLSEQMATVWPLTDEQSANAHNVSASPASEQCPEIVKRIDIITSGSAIDAATRADAGARFRGVGPFLIAWSPATMFGQTPTVVLTMDLSNVTTVEEATSRFAEWRVRIEQNPQLWRNGWSLESLRTTIRQFADKYGPGILSLLGVSPR